MKPFDYVAASSVADAVRALGDRTVASCVIAGGTDLLIELRRPSARMPARVVDISRIASLKSLSASDGSVVIGPLVTHSMLAASPLLAASAPFLCQAASQIGSVQIRNRGTVGGNIMNAAACADTVPPLIALGASVRLESFAGTREMRLCDLFVQPYQTRAQPDELLTEIRFPPLEPGARACFIKLGRRNAVSIARLSVAAVVRLDEAGRISDARIVPGSAFPTWRRAEAAEGLLLGERPSTALFEAAAARVSEQMVTETGRRWSTEYKEPVIAVLVRRALEQCVRAAA